MKIYQVIQALERFAPLPLQESWDNAGLQVGLTSAEASGALLCLDVTESIIDEAIEKHCNIVVSHHPLLFHKLSSLTGQNMVERIVMRAVKADITILSLHTNMDNALQGVNFKMAQKMGLEHTHFIAPRMTDGIENGSTVCGVLPEAMTSEAFVAMVKERFAVECAMTNGLNSRPIRSVAICGGAGGSFIGDAIEAKADAFVTGEMHYHDFFDHEDIQIVVIGHFQSEQYTSEIFKEILQRECPDLPAYIAQSQRNPIVYV